MDTPKAVTEKEVPKQSPMPPIEFRRDEDFFSGYANNAYLESTGWDLKLIFGQTDLKAGDNVVIQHTAITLPWPYAKVLSYFLQMHIAAHEAENGHVAIPNKAVLEPPSELPPELVGKLKHPKEGLAVMHKLWKEFSAANPEAKP